MKNESRINEIDKEIQELQYDADRLEPESDKEYDKPNGPQTATNQIRRIYEKIQKLKQERELLM